MAAPVQRVDHNIISDDVQFFLHFTLHVLGLGATQHTDQIAPVNQMRYFFAGGYNVIEQHAEGSRRIGQAALLLDNELGQGYFVSHAFFPVVWFPWCVSGACG